MNDWQNARLHREAIDAAQRAGGPVVLTIHCPSCSKPTATVRRTPSGLLLEVLVIAGHAYTREDAALRQKLRGRPYDTELDGLLTFVEESAPAKAEALEEGSKRRLYVRALLKQFGTSSSHESTCRCGCHMAITDDAIYEALRTDTPKIHASRSDAQR